MDTRLSSGRTGYLLIFLPIVMLTLASLACGGSGSATPTPRATPTGASRLTPTDKRVSPAATLSVRAALNSASSDEEAMPSPTLPAAPSPTAQPQGEVAQVMEVIDGDTIDVVMGGERYRVRYIGIDTPETKDPSRPVEPFGPEAAARNAELVGGKTVRLEKDVSETDRYGRLLRYVWVGDLMVNAELVRLGYALVSTYPPDVRYQDLFLRLQQEARAAGRGIWAQGATPTPPPATAIANTNARLHAGPGTHYQQVGGVLRGTALEIVARNEAGDWYQLAGGAWIFGELVSNAPTIPVATVILTAAPTAVAPAATPLPAPPEPVRASNCDPSYPTVCIPPPPPDLDCGEIPYRRFQVVGADPHRFDGDHDGIGCER